MSPSHDDQAPDLLTQIFPAELERPTQLQVALLLDTVRNQQWKRGHRPALVYFIAAAFAHDPHLQGIRDRLALLLHDAADHHHEESYLGPAMIDQDIDRFLADVNSYLAWLLDQVDRPHEGELEWKPDLLCCLVRGRLARGENDPARLRELLAKAEKLTRLVPVLLRYPRDEVPPHLIDDLTSA